jgi:chemotaxis protein CheZ
MIPNHPAADFLVRGLWSIFGKDHAQGNESADRMAAPRKVFRIEEMAAMRASRRVVGAQAAALRSAAGSAAPAEALQADLREALGTLRATVAATAHPATDHSAPRGETERLGIDATHLTRIAQELDAVVGGTAQATQKILAAAEEIDQAADNLSAALKGKIEQGAAQDIRDLVIRIFEACNFQDLIGQRVTKVMTTLGIVEDHIARVIAEIKKAPTSTPAVEEMPQYLHGPRLDFDRGHVTQAEIDAIFAG